MCYSFEIGKFIYNQYFFGGLRSALGISLPAMLILCSSFSIIAS